MTQEKRENVITNVTAIVSDMQEEVDEWKDYSDSELSHGLTCDCDWWYAALQTLKDALALLKSQEPVSVQKKQIEMVGLQTWDWVCGNCGQTVLFSANFCPWCGRAVKWE